MKTTDLFFALLFVALFLPFFLNQELFEIFKNMSKPEGYPSWVPYILAFLKFGVLATLGESLGLRIKKGVYNEPGFGLIPRAVVWGFLGVWIAASMKAFGVGGPVVAQSLGIEGAVDAMKGDFSIQKLCGSFFISLLMNTSFAPVFMTIHKVTDTHILNHGGSLKSLVAPIPFGKFITQIDWKVQWGFVFKKTIPYFWIPAHTITFLLPVDYQVLFAALLGIVLGVFLSVSALKVRQ